MRIFGWFGPKTPETNTNADADKFVAPKTKRPGKNLPAEITDNIDRGKSPEEKGQLLQILETMQANSKIYDKIISELFLRNKDQFSSEQAVRQYFKEANTNTAAGARAKLIERSFGAGTFRLLSFTDSRQDAPRSVLNLLNKRIKETDYENQVEKGAYLNLLENYGVEWSMEKIGRDTLQNFFDANGQTLDGIDISKKISKKSDISGKAKTIGSVTIRGQQKYDWKELIHFGGTTKIGSETAVGGFGEGLKICAFLLLRDFGATSIKAGSDNWELEYYFDSLPHGAYSKPIKGLFAKKIARQIQSGNHLEIIFEGSDVEEKIKTIEESKKLFYSKENPDFANSSFNSKIGGFSILFPEADDNIWNKNKYGHLYLAGQRAYYSEKDKWETVENVNLWTWIKVQPKDRDRGMITRQELTELVVPPIVNSMNNEETIKSVYDFKPLYEHLSVYSVGSILLETMVEKLQTTNVKLKFEQQYLASDSISTIHWIREAMNQQGFKFCPRYMAKIGMKSAQEKFLEMQSHSRIEATPDETKKINLLKIAAKAIGLDENMIKDIWLFSEKGEKNIFSGQSNSMFYWVSQEKLSEGFHQMLDIYIHEASHKAGSHGDPKFDYFLEQNKRKIIEFILNHKEEWDKFAKIWNRPTA